MINVHASLLPKYRGAAPVHRAVIDGATETGVTIMRMVVALDAGAMIAKVTRPVGPDETSDVVERDLARLGVPPLLSVIEQLAAGTAREEPQDESQSTYAARLTKEEGLIDWTLPATAIHNRVRGLYPWPHAYTYASGKRLIVLKSRVDETATGSDPGSDPGTVVDVSRDGISVAAGQGTRLALLELQPEGRRAMAVRDFLAGHPIQPEIRLGSGPGQARVRPGPAPNDGAGTNGGLSRPRRHYRRPRRPAGSARRQPLVARRRPRPRPDGDDRDWHPQVAAGPRSSRRALRQTAADEDRSGRPRDPSSQPLPAPAPRSRSRSRRRGRCGEPDAGGAKVERLRIRERRSALHAASTAPASAAATTRAARTIAPPRSPTSA